MKEITLANGVRMPVLGYGVYKIGKPDCVQCVLDALETGYRSVDTAQFYHNEEEVGKALSVSGIPRKDIFLTTKVWMNNYGYENAKASVYRSMEKLKTDYLDLCLLHQPFGDYYGAWRALEELYDAGIIRAIGVSNFYADRLVDICLYADMKPMVNQMETHPINQQKELLVWMQKYGVRLEAWSPFARGRGDLFENPVILGIAAKYGKTAAQVILRWHIQRDVIVIPKSAHRERIRENFSVFDFSLTDEDMAAMAALDEQRSLFFSHRDPERVEIFNSMK
ncbi:MAG: aldo/keto reductase [Clostridia bacterium]|nr:aldo/keto reductase [Clostridia bacterium]